MTICIIGGGVGGGLAGVAEVLEDGDLAEHLLVRQARRAGAVDQVRLPDHLWPQGRDEPEGKGGGRF